MRRVLPWLTAWIVAIAPAVGAQDVRAMFIHETTANNTFLHATQLDHPAVNDDPDVIIVVTPIDRVAPAVDPEFNDHFVGLDYSASTGRWTIYNEDFMPMPLGVGFHVVVAAPGPRAFVHTATAANTNLQRTLIDRSVTNDAPAARLFVTHLDGPGGAGGPEVDQPLWTKYLYGAFDQWSIQTQTGSALPVGASFNVIVPDAATTTLFRHETTPATVGGPASRIDHPSLNGFFLPFLVTMESEFGFGSNPHPFGVARSPFDRYWYVANFDEADMPVDLLFNVWAPLGLFTDGFEIADLSAWSGSTLERRR